MNKLYVGGPLSAPLEVRIALGVAQVSYVLGFLIALGFAALGYLLFRSPEMALVNLSFSVPYLICLLLDSFGKWNFARVVFFTTMALQYAMILICFGPFVGIEVFLAVLLCLPLLIFAKTERALIAIAYAVLTCGFVGAEWVANTREPLLPMPEHLHHVGYLGDVISLSLGVTFLLYYYSRSSIANHLKLQKELLKSEQMLYELVPAPIADELLHGHQIVAQSQGECTVLFADLVGFTKISNLLSPIHLVELLNGIFSQVDAVCETKGIEKIKTIGDCYMAATGVFPGQNRLSEMGLVAHEIVKIVASWSEQTGYPLAVRVGISTGQVVSGVIGKKRPLFDIWGQTVNTAQFLESNCPMNCILVSESTYWRLRGEFEFEAFGPVTSKAGTELSAYVLKAPKKSEEQLAVATSNSGRSGSEGLVSAPLPGARYGRA